MQFEFVIEVFCFKNHHLHHLRCKINHVEVFFHDCASVSCAAKELSCHGEEVASYETSHEKFEPQYGLEIIQRWGILMYIGS